MMRLLLSGLVIAGFCSLNTGQIVSFNSPSPWLTQRNDEIVVKAHFDTAQIYQQTAVMTLYRTSENGSRRRLATRTVTIDDYTQEISLGNVGTHLLGGKDFLSVNWLIKDSVERKGAIIPIAIAALPELPAPDTLAVKKVGDDAGADKLIAKLSGNNVYTIGEQHAGLFWNYRQFILVVKKSPGLLTFAVDGKNGKYAFLSYPDRFLSVFSDTDSIYAYHHKRAMQHDTIAYSEAAWLNEISTESQGDYFIVRVPFYDMGFMKPFTGRQWGFALFAGDAENKAQSVHPANAGYYNPASWGNAVAFE
ncbi:MAG: hypothetical protein GF398_05525 [Chitinivibrionales bacterium]|nr:hypothetical protein [Chitinivibrionales bacterium]